jgi:hypothetical protein
MIEQLTKEKLIEYGFDNEIIEMLLKFEIPTYQLQNNKGDFFASSIDGKIYSAEDANRKEYFKDIENPKFPFRNLDLVPEYYELLEAAYIETKRKKAGIIFNEKATKEKLRLEQIEWVTEVIIDTKAYLKDRTYKPNYKLNTLEIHEFYLQYLNDLVELRNTSTEKIKLQSIFLDTNNSFELFKELLEDLEITIQGNVNTKKGRMGKITGLITALKETPNIFKLEKRL